MCSVLMYSSSRSTPDLQIFGPYDIFLKQEWTVKKNFLTLDKKSIFFIDFVAILNLVYNNRSSNHFQNPGALESMQMVML